ncbi:exosortase A [Methylomonas koyamae]|uniref:Exosortase A n=1 Tax=Methylomonas koyamae TaxID=702114 RepID=A0A177NAM6_9GAMM|nr:exosortase A [Methylomonas koyamae]OAI15108.1 exosortase A [Methylomonas koyamae]
MINPVGLPLHWRKPLFVTLLVTLFSLLVFAETWASIVAIWSRSETFTHGFLVAPTSLWLIWLRRQQYRNLQAQFSWFGLLGAVAGGFLWLVADLVHVLVVQQWAVVGILVSSLWAVLGTNVISSMLFPILFLFLMVPFGEAFIPPLMDYTATFVVTLLRLTGISVYREGLFFTLTSGNWSVVEGCSGLRYLISSFTLGAVYAYLNYTSNKKRAVFIAVSFLAPIIANGFRAYMIVMIGHLSSMKLATGVDHIVYGWVFFGIVMFALFYLGSFWHDAPLNLAVNTPEEPGAAEIAPQPGYGWFGLAAILVCLAIWPPISQGLSGLQNSNVVVPVGFSQPQLDNWQPADAPDWGWEPNFKGVVAESRTFFNDGQALVGLYFANFGDESQGGELVNSQNYLVPQKHKIWRMLRDSDYPVAWASGESVVVEEAVLNSSQRDLLAWRWYRIGDKTTDNAYLAKWWQLVKRLSGDSAPELLVVLYTETANQDFDTARDKLRQIALACCS